MNSSGSTGEREALERLENRLKRIEDRLLELEKLLLSGNRKSAPSDALAAEALAIALRLLKLSESTVDLASAARRLANAHLLASRVRDDISRAIIEVVAQKGPINLSALTAELKRYRGRASRRIVAAKVSKLAEEGLLKVEKRGRDKVVDLPPKT